MKRFYNFLVVAVSMLAFTTLSYGQLDCPVANISAGATNVMGTDYVCESSSITITWNPTTDPGVTGYRLRVGNDAQIDNLNVEYVAHDGSPSYSATFNVGAGQGNSYSYTVDYTKDGGFNPAFGPSYDYSAGDCTNEPNPYPNFIIATDPTPVTTATITNGTDGVANTYCANSTIEVTADGTPGDIGQYYWSIDGGTTWNAAGTNNVFEIDATVANGFTTAGAVDIEVATADLTCGFNDPIASQFQLNTTLRDIYQVTGISTTDDGAIADGDTVCFDGSGTDVFSIAYTDVLGTGTNGTIQVSNDGGASFAAGATGASPLTATIAAENTDYAFFIDDAAYCQNNKDTVYAFTYDNVNSAPAPAELEYSVDGGMTWLPYMAFSACEGETVQFRVNTATDGDAGNNPNSQFRWEYDADNDGLLEQATGNLNIGDGGENVYTTPVLVSGNVSRVRIRFFDNCTGAQTVGAFASFNVVSGGDATGSSTTLTDEGAATLNNGDNVCPGEQIDFAVTGAADLGANGEYRVYKTIDGGTTYNLIGSGVDPLNITNHDHGLVSAEYHTVIVNDCDSIAVENITINVLTISSAPTSVTDNSMGGTVCPGDNVTFTANGGSLSAPANGVYQYSTNGGATWTTTGNAGADNFITLAVGASTTVLFRIQDDCGNYPAIAPFPSSTVGVYTIATAPSGANAAPAGPVCPNTSVTFTATGGSIAGANATYEYRVNAGAWTPTGNAGTDNFYTASLTATTTVDFRIVDLCDPAVQTTVQSASVTVLGTTDTPTFDSYEERQGISDVAVMANAEICNGSDLVFNYTMGASVTTDDNPVVYYKENGAGMFDMTAVGGLAPASNQEIVVEDIDLTAGNNYQLFFNSDCGMEVALGAAFTITYKEENSNAAALTSMDVNSGDFVCSGNGVMITLNNAGTLGDANNFDGLAPEFAFETNIDGGGFVLDGAHDGSANYMIDIDDLVTNDGLTNQLRVRSSITNGCTPTGFTAEFVINIYGAQNNFTSISLTNDNYCADEAATLPVTMTANGAALVNDGFTRVVWYSIDDAGNPVTKVKETLAGTGTANQLLFNGGDGVAPDTTTTIGVRLESCDTSAFEVRTITVKDLPENNDEAGNPAVVSASPSSVCAGASSTLNIINYIVGTNGQVTWYDDMMASNLLATGPSFTASNLFNTGASTDTTFYVRVEADCDTTMLLPVTVNLSSVNPEPVQNFGGISAAGATMVGNAVSLGTICDEENIAIDAGVGEVGDGSYIWEISFDGIVFSSIDDATPGDFGLFLNTGTFSLNFDANGETTVFIRARRTNGCITTANRYASLVVRELPTDFTSIAPATEEVCETDAAVTLTANGGDAGFDGVIRWYLDYNATGAVAVPAWDGMTSVTFDWNNFSGAGVYDISVQYESAACGAFVPTPAVAQVTVNATPMNDLGVNPVAEVCSNSSIDLATLSSYTGMNQSFSFTGTGVAANVYDAANGSYPDATAENFETITYSVTENGCTANFAVTLEVNGTPVINDAVATIASCGANDGTVEVTSITGGEAGYEYSSDDGANFNPANPMTNLSGGNKNIRVKDAENCVSEAFVINVPNSSGFASAGTVDTPVSCNGDADGEVSVTLSNGLSPFDYEVFVDGGVTAIESANNQTATDYTFDNLAPGAYDFEFTDAAGCLTTYSVVLNEPGIIGLTVANAEDVDCFGEETGVLGNLSATSSNGGPFMYQLSIDTSGNQEFEVVSAFNMANNYTGLAAGDYLITVKDGNDCTNDFLFTIEEPEAIVLDTNVVALDQDGYDVQIVVQSGGVGQFEYRLNNGTFQASNLFEDLPFGTYDFTARDANGCEETITIQLRDPNSINEAAVFADVVAYPNPFAGVITVEGLQDGVNITITNVYGQQVDFIASMKDGKAVINTIDLASGVYFATFTKDGASKTIRMVKQ